jgi:hypothetical protein
VAALINERNAEVSVGAQTWKFALDAGRGTVFVELEGSRYTLRAQSWQQKRMLARFAHLDDRFLEEQLLRSSLSAGESPPEDGPGRDALLALARWINAPGGRPGLPLDQQLLARVWLHVSRAIQSAPQAFDTLDAADVEMLWRAARADAPETEESEGAGNRILVVPDPNAPGVNALEPPRVTAGVTEAVLKPDVPAPEAVQKPALQNATVSASAPKAQSVRGESPRANTQRFRVRHGAQAQRLAPRPTTEIHAPDISRPGDEHGQAHVSANAPSASRAPVPSMLKPMLPSSWTPAGAIREETSAGQWSTSVVDSVPASQPIMGAAMMHAPASRTSPVDHDPLFEELAARLEQAVLEHGIDGEP